jgi:hypothetical protein
LDGGSGAFTRFLGKRWHVSWRASQHPWLCSCSCLANGTTQPDFFLRPLNRLVRVPKQCCCWFSKCVAVCTCRCVARAGVSPDDADPPATSGGDPARGLHKTRVRRAAWAGGAAPEHVVAALRLAVHLCDSSRRGAGGVVAAEDGRPEWQRDGLELLCRTLGVQSQGRHRPPRLLSWTVVPLVLAGYCVFGSLLFVLPGATAVVCPAGRYSPSGASPCTVCPAATPFSVAGSTSASACSACASGCDGAYGRSPCVDETWTLWYDTGGVETANRCGRIYVGDSL